ncbi:hypothetical protein NQZ68_017392 [Dissostichus eleginoides]|nr:hypothetical protein NQZ68_017392 [Dissostichus eleginoides]
MRHQIYRTSQQKTEWQTEEEIRGENACRKSVVFFGDTSICHLPSSWGTEVLVAMMTALELLTPPDVHSMHHVGGRQWEDDDSEHRP